MKSDVLKAIKDWGIRKFQPKGNYLTEIPASIADFNPHNYFSFSGGKEIQSGGDLDHMTEIGNYYCTLNSAVNTLLNCPVSKAFIMKIFKGTGNLYLTQMIRCYNGEIVYRYQNINNQWQAWEHLYEPMKAATASTAGKEGLVPAPDTGKQNAYLRGDATWVTPATTLAGTVEGIPLDQTMGKQLKDEIDSQNLSFANSINGLTTYIDAVDKKLAIPNLLQISFGAVPGDQYIDIVFKETAEHQFLLRIYKRSARLVMFESTNGGASYETLWDSYWGWTTS